MKSDEYVVYTEIVEDGGVERWYYGTYDRRRANEVASELGSDYPVFHCVCNAEDAIKLNIQNLPAGF